MVKVRELKAETITLKDPEYTDPQVFVGRQEETIRKWASEHGYETLRGFHMMLRSEGWSYYDILKEVYK